MSALIDMKLRQSAFDVGNLTGHDMTSGGTKVNPPRTNDLYEEYARTAAQDVAEAWPRLWPQPTAQPAYNAVMGTSTDPNPSAAERFEF